MSELSPVTPMTYSVLASDVLDKLRITNAYSRLTPTDIERARRLLFRRSNDALPPLRRKMVLRPVLMVGEYDDDRVKRVCWSKFKIRVDSVCDLKSSFRGAFDVVGSGKIAVVIEGVIVGVAPHAGKWCVPDLLPHVKPGSVEWKGALDHRAWSSSNLQKCTLLAQNLARCCGRQLDIKSSGDFLLCRLRKRRREDDM